jgi:hypothetical protein
MHKGTKILFGNMLLKGLWWKGKKHLFNLDWIWVDVVYINIPQGA